MNHEKELDLVDFIAELIRSWRIIVLMTLTVVTATVFFLQFKPKSYASYAIILPTDTEGNVLGGLSSAVGALSSGFFPGMPNTSHEKIRMYSKTTRVGELIVDRLGEDLYPAIFPYTWDPAKKQFKDKKPEKIDIILTLLSFIVAEPSKTNLLAIDITAETYDPIMSKKILDELIIALRQYSNELELAGLEHKKNFFLKQLEKSKETILAESKQLTQFYRTFNTSTNNSEISVNLNNYTEEQSLPTALHDGKTINVPVDSYLNYLTVRQGVLSQLNASLEQQLQMLQIGSEHKKMGFDIIEYPRVDMSPSHPKPKLLLALAVAGGLVLGVFTVVTRNFLNLLLGRLKNQSL